MIPTQIKSAAKCAWLTAVAFTLASCTTPSTTEFLDWSTEGYVQVYEGGTGWKGIGGEETLQRIYTTPGSTAEDWVLTLDVECLPIAITFMSEIRWNPESILNADKRNHAKRGCDDPWLVIISDSTSLLYERPEVNCIGNCPGYLHQYELGRIVMGEWYSWWLRYRIRNRALTEAEKSELISRLEKARVARKEL